MNFSSTLSPGNTVFSQPPTTTNLHEVTRAYLASAVAGTSSWSMCFCPPSHSRRRARKPRPLIESELGTPPPRIVANTQSVTWDLAPGRNSAKVPKTVMYKFSARPLNHLEQHNRAVKHDECILSEGIMGDQVSLFE